MRERQILPPQPCLPNEVNPDIVRRPYPRPLWDDKTEAPMGVTSAIEGARGVTIR